MSDQEREYGQNDLRSVSAEVQAAEAELAAAQARLDAARARAQAEAQAAAQVDGQQVDGQQASSYYTYRVDCDQPPQSTYQAGYTNSYSSSYPNNYSNGYPNNYQDPYRQYPQSHNQGFQAYTGSSTKDHVAAGLLAIFIGALGIHKFYLGYNSTAFIMLAVTVLGGLLTFGLASTAMAVIAVVEGIIYLTKSQADFEHIYVLNKREWF